MKGGKCKFFACVFVFGGVGKKKKKQVNENEGNKVFFWNVLSVAADDEHREEFLFMFIIYIYILFIFNFD